MDTNNKLNDDLQHIQIGRDKEVPIETNTKLWFLWVYDDGEWDSERITRSDSILEKINDENVKNVFCTWHGMYKTNLFLMDKQKLIKRLKKLK